MNGFKFSLCDFYRDAASVRTGNDNLALIPHYLAELTNLVRCDVILFHMIVI